MPNHKLGAVTVMLTPIQVRDPVTAVIPLVYYYVTLFYF